MWRPLLVGIVLACTQTGCVTTSRSVSPREEFDVRHAAATRAWLVVDGSQTIGEMVRYDDRAGARFFYSVRNLLHQELGLIDSLGRAYRFRAHQPEPTWTGTGPVLEGVRRILESSSASELREVAVSELLLAREPR